MLYGILPLLLSLLFTASAVAQNFQEWLETRAQENATSEATRVISFAAPEDATVESLAATRQWTVNGVNLSASRPSIPPLESAAFASASFNGIDSELVVPAWSDAGFSDQVSVGLWIKPDLSMFSESRESRFIVSKSASREAGFHIGINERRQITVGIVTANGYSIATTGSVIEPYRWHHIGFSWSGETLQIYIDGKPQGTPAQAQAPYRDYAASLTFGRPASLQSNYYRGELSEFILTPEAFPAQP